MKIHEYQAKEILKSFGVPVPEGGGARTPERRRKPSPKPSAGMWSSRRRSTLAGRGKGGGIKLAADPSEANGWRLKFWALHLVTPQTGSEGQKVQSVWVEQATDIDRELYLGHRA